MAFDPNKMRAFIDGPEVVAESMPMPPTAPRYYEPYKPDGVLEGSVLDVMLDDPSNLSKQAMVHRLMEPQVAYQEMKEKAGAFSCGTCRYSMDGFCAKQNILAYVSMENGCCNMFEAKDRKQEVEPTEWAASLMDGEGDGEEGDEDEDTGDDEDGDDTEGEDEGD